MFSGRIQIVKLLYLRRYLLSSKKLTPVPSGIKYLWLEYNMIIREQFNKKNILLSSSYDVTSCF